MLDGTRNDIEGGEGGGGVRCWEMSGSAIGVGEKGGGGGWWEIRVGLEVSVFPRKKRCLSTSISATFLVFSFSGKVLSPRSIDLCCQRRIEGTE